jgi:hypothetical protein
MERDGAVEAAAVASKQSPVVASVRAVSPRDRVLALQRSAGNRAVKRMIAAGRLPAGAQPVRRPAVGRRVAQADAGGRLRPELEDATDEYPEVGGWLSDAWNWISGSSPRPATAPAPAPASSPPQPTPPRSTPAPTAPSSTPATPPPPAAPTSMSIANVSGPTTADCGEFDWRVNFTLPTPSPAGGWFVQELSIRRRATDCAGTAVPRWDMNHHYWEAWRVRAGGTQDELVANGTFNYADMYRLGSCGSGTKGTFSYVGSVRYYEGLTLPRTFIPNNPATIAHDLPSTTTDPRLPGGTPALAHSISGSWNCCPAGTSSRTSITSRSP